MTPQLCWGIYREAGPGSGSGSDPTGDGALILQATASALEAHGFQPRLCPPDELPDLPSAPAPRIFAMCREPDALHALARLEAKGAIIVNPPAAVSATDGDHLAKVLRRARVPFDPKAGGDRITFCGIGDRFAPPSQAVWFRCHDDRDPNQDIRAGAFSERTLTGIALRAAGALGVEIFGGKAVVSQDGDLSLVEMVAWPSFARFRNDAAGEIAALLARRFAPRPGGLDR